MSLEAFGDSDEGMSGPEGYVTEERAKEYFVGGLQAMREMLARFVEHGGNPDIAISIRANWNPSWGPDPGKPDEVYADCWSVP